MSQAAKPTQSYHASHILPKRKVKKLVKRLQNFGQSWVSKPADEEEKPLIERRFENSRGPSWRYLLHRSGKLVKQLNLARMQPLSRCRLCNLYLINSEHSTVVQYHMN